jgi:hypothetical protein
MKDGRVDAVSTDDIQLAGFASLDNTLKLVGGQFTTELYGIGVKKGKTDLTFVDAELAKMLSDGRWEALYKVPGQRRRPSSPPIEGETRHGVMFQPAAKVFLSPPGCKGIICCPWSAAIPRLQ